MSKNVATETAVWYKLVNGITGKSNKNDNYFLLNINALKMGLFNNGEFKIPNPVSNYDTES
ncbi:MAG: hypothetical protein QW469_02175 [Candidatus Aenigmatarchaeota archaeon]